MSRRFATGDDARAEVLRRAAVSIAEHGYHGMSMRDLARSTGRGLASFYHLFRSKEDILFELQQRAFQELCESAEASLGGPRVGAEASGASTRLRCFIENHVRFVVEEPDLMRVLVQEASTLPPESRAVIRALKQRYFDLGARLLGGVAAESGAESPLPPMEIERASYCMFGMLNWSFGWYEPERHGTSSELSNTIFTLITNGVAGERK